VLAISTADAQVVASIVLVVVTTLYSGFTLLAVIETRRTRKQQVRPALALDLVTVEQSRYVEVGIVNVGQGAALDVDLELSFYRNDGGEPVCRRFTWPLIRPGQTHQFAPPDVDGKRRPNLEIWAPVYPRVTLSGTVRDQLDKPHDIDLTVPHVADLRARAMDAGLAGPRAVAAQRQFKSLSEAASAISSTLEQIESALSRRREDGEP
jgi:hypothetical protein